MCMVGDDDWDFYTESRQKARIEHRCCECGRTIHRGETYATQGGAREGTFEWHKTCAHCDAASEWLNQVCNGYVFASRQEDFLEHVTGHEKELRSRPLVRLVRWMLADWRTKAGDLRPVEDVAALTAEAVAAYKSYAA